MSVGNNLRGAAELFDAKDAEYGHSYLRTEKLLAGFFPNGVTLDTPAKMARFHCFMNCMMKMNRYAHNLEKGGHMDSVDDLMVYASILKDRTE